MHILAPIFIVAAMTGGAACSMAPESSPTSPTALVVTESADVQRGVPDRPALVTLRGTVRDLNDRHTQFTLVVRSDSADPRPVTIRLDERTIIQTDGHGARRGLLQNGQLCGVEGIRRDDGVLARRITIVRHGDRR